MLSSDCASCTGLVLGELSKLLLSNLFYYNEGDFLRPSFLHMLQLVVRLQAYSFCWSILTTRVNVLVYRILNLQLWVSLQYS